jgi:hypothetical protein
LSLRPDCLRLRAASLVDACDGDSGPAPKADGDDDWIGQSGARAASWRAQRPSWTLRAIRLVSTAA